jgi:MFS family permease
VKYLSLVRSSNASAVGWGRAFRALWLSTGSANLGDGIALFTLPLLALAVGATPAGVAAVTSALTLAWLVFGLHAGWLVDRLPRRAMLITVNVARAGVLLVLAGLHANDSLGLPTVIIAAGVLGVAETLADTALTSTVPLVVRADARTRANARIEATVNVTNQLAGPPLAGLLIGIGMTLALASGSVLYALSVAAVAAVVLRPDVAPSAPLAVPTGVGAGLRHLWRQPVLRALTLFTAAMNVVWAAWTALFVIYAVRPGPLDLTPVQYGFLLTAMAIGGVLASTSADALRRRFGAGRLLVADAAGTVLLVAPAAVGAPLWVVAAGAVVAGSGASIWRILVATIRQDLTPPDLLGRTYSASRVVSWGVLPVAAALAGLAAEHWGVPAVLGISTVLAVGVLVAFIAFTARQGPSAAGGAVRPKSVRRRAGRL